MILRGILDRSLNGTPCIRGFANLSDLEKISRADMDYQRDLIHSQEMRIKEFLMNRQYLFFPEIILAYIVTYNYNKKYARSGIIPIDEILNSSSFESNMEPIKFQTFTKSYRGKGDARGSEDIKFVTINIDDNFLQGRIAKKDQPFFRIDGNHRLSAAAEFEEISIKELSTPFCLMLLEDNPKSLKFQKVVFHNINSKSVPLTPEENLSVILSDEKNFSNDELKDEKGSFGWPYYATRVLSSELNKNTIKSKLPFLYNSFLNPNDERTLFCLTTLASIISFLLEKEIIKTNEKCIKDIRKALDEVNSFFSSNPSLQQIKHSGFLIAFLYFQLKKEQPSRLASFINWFLKNHLFEINQIDASSIISIYNKISDTKRKEIFVSMQFGIRKNEAHYRNIKEAIEEINNEKNEAIQFRPIRIDKFNPGYSYIITDEILRAINTSGYLIADLTGGNKNVYHEVGYLMGYNASKDLPPNNILLVARKEEGKEFSKEIGFNLRHYQVKSFEEVDELKSIVKESIIKYYEL